MVNYDNKDWNDTDKFLIGKFPPRLEFLNIEFYKDMRTVASILILLTALIFLVPLM